MSSIENRPAAGLYLIGWLLAGTGGLALLIGVQAAPPVRGVLIVAALLLLLAGLAAAAGYQIVARRTRPAGRFRGPAPLLVFGFHFVLVNAVSLALITLGVPLADTPAGFLTAAVVLLAAYIVVVWLFAIRSGALTWHELGLPRGPGAGRLIADVAIAGATMLLVALAAGFLGGVLARLLETSAPQVVPTPREPLDIALTALGAGILVPIGEELFFRGYALTAWLRDLGPRAALWRSTAFFAVVHVATISSATFVEGAKQALLVLAVIGPVGFVLGWIYLRRGLVAAIAGHAAFNLFAVAILVLAQQLRPPP